MPLLQRQSAIIKTKRPGPVAVQGPALRTGLNLARNAPAVSCSEKLQHRLEQLAHFGWIASGADAASFHDLKLGVSRIGAAGDERACVAHALPGRRCNASDEADYRLLHVVLGPLSRVHLVRSADLADHDDGVSIGVFVEHLEHIHVLEAVNRVASNTE